MPWSSATPKADDTDPVQGVKESYERGVTDEFINPFVIVDDRSEPVGTIRDDDVCIFFNYRADRARQMTRCLARNSHFTAQDGARTGRRRGSRCRHTAQPRSQRPDVHLHDQYDKHFTLPLVSPPESLTISWRT